MATQYRSRSRPPSELVLTAETLMNRYPDLDAEELETLIDIFPKLPILDVGLMTADENLSEQLGAFHSAHGHKFKTPAVGLILFLMAFVAMPAAMVGGIIWWVL